MHGLRNKILLLTLLPLFLVLVIINAVTIYNQSRTERDLLLQRVSSYRTLLESGDLSFDTSQDKTKLEEILSEKVEFAEILRKDYSVIYSTENSAAPLITDAEKKDVNDAFNGYETTKTIVRNGRSAFVIISPLIANNQAVAVLHEGLSNEESSKRVGQYAVYVFLLAAAGMAVCYVLVTTLLNSVVLKNIYNLQQATIEMRKGNLVVPISVNTNDEIGDFARMFDDMRTEVRTAKLKLEEYNKQLEDEVKQRTVELESKVGELERMNKLMMGREVRMAELKKQIEELQSKIPQS